MKFDAITIKRAKQVLNICKSRNILLTTAESCTGGMVIGALTEISGSSNVVESGFITYSNEAKIEMLGVPEEMIARFGAVSETVAVAMALGALENSCAYVTASVTGIAGPRGGTKKKPVGLVYFAVASRSNQLETAEMRFGKQSRTAIRTASVNHSLEMIRKFLNKNLIQHSEF